MAITLDGTTGIAGYVEDSDVQAQATWEAGTDTTESLVSPEKIKAAIDALAGGGMTLLGTLSVNSGASWTLSSLDLTGYKFLHFVVNGLSVNNSNDYLTLDGRVMAKASAIASSKAYLDGRLELSTGVCTTSIVGVFNAANNFQTILDSWSGGHTPITYNNATTSITFALVNGTSLGGSITVYGVA